MKFLFVSLGFCVFVFCSIDTVGNNIFFAVSLSVQVYLLITVNHHTCILHTSILRFANHQMPEVHSAGEIIAIISDS